MSGDCGMPEAGTDRRCWRAPGHGGMCLFEGPARLALIAYDWSRPHRLTMVSTWSMIKSTPMQDEGTR